MKKIALVLSGGGMTCSYTAGFVGALAKEHGFVNPDILIAGSGSAGTASYYVAGQYDSVMNIWSQRLSTRRFIDLFRIKRILDIDYLVDVVFKKKEPLDIKKIHRSGIEFQVPALDVDSGNVKYFSNRNEVDWFEVLRATKAMPLLYNKKVDIDGHEYCDSVITSEVGLNIIHSIALGATDIVVVETDEKSNIVEMIGYDLWVDTKNKVFKHHHKMYEQKIAKFKLPEKIRVVRVLPKEKLPVNVIDNKRKDLHKAIKQGYKECIENNDLIQFFSELKVSTKETMSRK